VFGVRALHIGGHVAGHRALLLHDGDVEVTKSLTPSIAILIAPSDAATSPEMPWSASISVAILSVACVAGWRG
jgi:hypothetical protein